MDAKTAAHQGSQTRVDHHRHGHAPVDDRVHFLAAVRRRFVAGFGQSQLCERDVRQVNHLRSAEVVLAVDAVLVVLAWMRGDAAMRFLQQLHARTENDRTDWTDFRARGLIAVRETMTAQLALHDLRIELRPLEARHVERTTDFAEAAADTEAAIPLHDSEFPFR